MQRLFPWLTPAPPPSLPLFAPGLAPLGASLGAQRLHLFWANLRSPGSHTGPSESGRHGDAPMPARGSWGIVTTSGHMANGSDGVEWEQLGKEKPRSGLFLFLVPGTTFANTKVSKARWNASRCRDIRCPCLTMGQGVFVLWENGTSFANSKGQVQHLFLYLLFRASPLGMAFAKQREQREQSRPAKFARGLLSERERSFSFFGPLHLPWSCLGSWGRRDNKSRLTVKSKKTWQFPKQG